MLHIVEMQEARFHVEETGTGPVLLLVHGLPLNHAMWREQIGFLGQHYRVLAPDLRGFGGSTGAGEISSMEQFADDLAHLLDKLSIHQPVHYGGLSMGGYIGLHFWHRHRSRLASLMLCDCRAAADPPAGATQRLALADRALAEGMLPVADVMVQRLVDAESARQRPTWAEEVRAMILAAPVTGTAAALRGMAQRLDLTDWLARIDLPTLVIVGDRDAISPPAEMADIAARIPGAEIHVIPDAGHLAPWEQPATVNPLMLDFLQRLAKS